MVTDAVIFMIWLETPISHESRRDIVLYRRHFADPVGTFRRIMQIQSKVWECKQQYPAGMARHTIGVGRRRSSDSAMLMLV
jgi:hypothetical protein